MSGKVQGEEASWEEVGRERVGIGLSRRTQWQQELCTEEAEADQEGTVLSLAEARQESDGRPVSRMKRSQ